MIPEGIRRGGKIKGNTYQISQRVQRIIGEPSSPFEHKQSTDSVSDFLDLRFATPEVSFFEAFERAFLDVPALATLERVLIVVGEKALLCCV